MHAYYIIGLVAFLVVAAALLIRFVNTTIDKQFRSLARAGADAEFRRAELDRLDTELKGALPLPLAVKPLPNRGGGMQNALPSVFLTLGVISLWGGGAVREHRELWNYGGFAATGLAVLIMLATLGRRRRARIAARLLFRADLRRMDGDRAGAASDLRERLRLTPWDDSGWAELSDDLASLGDLDGALTAMEEASALDPRYDEYHMLQTSLAIRRNRFERARQALEDWRTLGGVDADDPRLAVYEAALRLGEGRRDEAEAALRTALRDWNANDMDFLESDEALDGVRTLLPERI